MSTVFTRFPRTFTERQIAAVRAAHRNGASLRFLETAHGIPRRFLRQIVKQGEVDIFEKSDKSMSASSRLGSSARQEVHSRPKQARSRNGGRPR